MSNVVEFISREDYEEAVQDHMEATFEAVSLQNGRLRVPKNKSFSRKDVVLAFETAFEAIGGVTRLALWANDNPTKFYSMYAKLLPTQASSALGEEDVKTIKHVLPRTNLDE